MNQPTPLVEEAYSELKLFVLEDHAKQWAKVHPCINRITLYKAGYGERQQSDTRYVLAVNALDFPEKKLPKNEDQWTEEDEKKWEIIKYYKWMEESCFHVRGEINEIYKEKTPDNFINQWMWYPLSPDEKMEDYNFDPDGDFVSVNTGFTLYARNHNDQSHKDHFQSLFMANRKEILKGDVFCFKQEFEQKVIKNERNLAFEKAIWDEKIQPISDRCFNGEFQYDPCPGVVELTDESIALVHNKIFQMFNKLIDFPTQLNQMVPSIDQGGRAKELILAFDDIVLKKFRAGLGNPEKNELFFDFLQNINDTNTMPAFLTYLGHYCNVTVNASKGTEANSDKVFQKRQSPIEIHPPIGTTWEQIRIRYVNDNHIEIAHPGVETHAPYSMVDLGLDSKPTLAALFKLFANHHGGINGEDMGTKDIKANVSNLRKHIKVIFPGIKESPIANFSRRDGYLCNFKIT